MKKLRLIWIVFIAATFVSCSDSNPTDPDSNENEEPSAEKQFVWDAMNYWYYWQGDVPALDDSYFDNDDEFYSYLNQYSDAEDVFESLIHQNDDFSFFIDDYEEYANEQDGIYAALGLKYGFFYKNSESSDLVGYVRYVIPDSPAEDAGLERLDLFTKVDGTTITENNFTDLLSSNSEHELTMAHIETSDDNVEFVDDSTVSIESREVIEDPIYLQEVIEKDGIKIGYLMYNSFQGNSHEQLNDVFGDFKDQDIDELVLDLRYNGGGAIITSQLLASMISGQSNSDKFAEFEYNQKRSDRNREIYFLDEVPLENEDGEFERDSDGNFKDTETMNNLSLDNVYVLTTSSTASASEALINGLNPYIDVTFIGYKTVGKDEGSLTLYDASSPYLEKDDANPDHKKAIQPIVLKIVNSNGEAYPDGFEPDGYTPDGCADDDNDNCVQEISVENLKNKPAIGDTEEPLFSRAIELITGQTAKHKTTSSSIESQDFKLKASPQELLPRKQQMYIEPFMMPMEK